MRIHRGKQALAHAPFACAGLSVPAAQRSRALLQHMDAAEDVSLLGPLYAHGYPGPQVRMGPLGFSARSRRGGGSRLKARESVIAWQSCCSAVKER